MLKTLCKFLLVCALTIIGIYLLLIIVLVILFGVVGFDPLPTNDRFCVEFNSLPSGRYNGEWAARAVYENSRFLRDSNVNLSDRIAVIRGEIISERSEATRTGIWSADSPHNILSFHQIKVLEVYQGNFKAWTSSSELREVQIRVGDIIEVRQIKKYGCHTYRGRNASGIFEPSEVDLVHRTWVPFSIGDDLILFLGAEMHLNRPTGWQEIPIEEWSYNWIHYRVQNPIQGVYYYTPEELRGGQENWVFEPVNPHNNLTLTEADLLMILDGVAVDN